MKRKIASRRKLKKEQTKNQRKKVQIHHLRKRMPKSQEANQVRKTRRREA
jgi:hypothetical protein